MKQVQVQFGRRYRQLNKLWREGGRTAVWERVRHAAAERLAPAAQHMSVRAEDVLAADLRAPRSWAMPASSGEAMIVNWVTTPPAPGSGGHTTMFRLIEHLEQSGHQCRVYIYDVFGNDIIYCKTLVKQLFPGFKGAIYDVCNGMAPAHAVVATSWPTAYPVYNDPCAGKRFYLVQDFEPWFYPVGGESTLAENTYRMGFHAITAGRFLAEKLVADYGMGADSFEFGCDTGKYHLLNGAARDGVVFYAKLGAPRRAFELGMMALQLFARRHPDLTIHLYGGVAGGLPFRCVDHGVLRPDQLNEIYNRCFAGLSLSMTNVSLVPHEMLSAGCIPVVNDAKYNRMVLANPHVQYAAPTPHALADALHEVVTAPDFGKIATAASASVAPLTWATAGVALEQWIRREVAAAAG